MKPYLIGVCGGSGSGKTTFCQQFVKTFGEQRILHISLDCYYKDYSHMAFVQRTQVNYDHPDSIEFSLLLENLDQLSLGRAALIPHHDFKTYTRLPEGPFVEPRPVILVEGILLFACPDVRKRFDHTIFIDTPEEERFWRRVQRDVRERNRTYESVQKQFESTVKAMHDVYVQPYKRYADTIVDGHASFENPIQQLCDLLNGVLCDVERK